MFFARIGLVQSKYTEQILAPWGINAPTGIVYHTTLRWINMLECPELALQIPALVPWSANPALPQPALAKAPALQGITLPVENTETPENNTINDSDLNSAQNQSAAPAPSITGGFWSKLKNKLFGN